MTQTLNDKFCISPWAHVVIRTTGALMPCCNYLNPKMFIKNNSIDDYYNSEEIKTIREKMLANQPVYNCRLCYQEENLVGSSMRLNLNRMERFEHTEDIEAQLQLRGLDNATFPSRIELHVGNICNLKCMICNSQDSSLMLAENKLLDIENADQKEYNFNENILKELTPLLESDKVKVLDLRGGESLLVPSIKKYLKDLNPIYLKEKTLRIQTNGTIFDSEWEEIFGKFNKVDVSVSIDAFGKDNEYLRFPSRWSAIESTVEQLKNIPNVEYKINTTVSNLSWLVLDKLLLWAIEKQATIHFSPLWEPKYFQILNLPKDLLKLHSEKIANIANTNQLQSDGSIQKILSYVESNLDNAMQDWSALCEMVNKRDKHRKVSVFSLNSELERFWIQ